MNDKPNTEALVPTGDQAPPRPSSLLLQLIDGSSMSFIERTTPSTLTTSSLQRDHMARL